MSDLDKIPNARRGVLILPPPEGPFVVKDPTTGGYFQVGEQEAFLLAQLDGQQTVETVCAAFRARFSEPFAPEDLEGFLHLARSQRLLQEDATADSEKLVGEHGRAQYSGQSLVFWRIPIFDP